MKRCCLDAELGRSTFALRRSDAAGGSSLPEGEIEAIVITNTPSIFGRPIFISMFNSTISSQTLVHLLCSIFVPEPQIVSAFWDRGYPDLPACGPVRGPP